MPRDSSKKKPRGEGKNPAPLKRSRGKPPMGETAKTVGFTVKMSQLEYERWKAAAAKQGKSLSEFILGSLRERTE